VRRRPLHSSPDFHISRSRARPLMARKRAREKHNNQSPAQVFAFRAGIARLAPRDLNRAILTLCSATGIIARTFLTLAGSMRAETMPTPSEALAITWPQGSATSEWP